MSDDHGPHYKEYINQLHDTIAKLGALGSMLVLGMKIINE